jgi:hypothetical protein
MGHFRQLLVAAKMALRLINLFDESQEEGEIWGLAETTIGTGFRRSMIFANFKRLQPIG